MIGRDCPLIFMHIPKTGGMSMFASICEHYGTQMADMYNMSAFDDDRTSVGDVLNNPEIGVYAGHFPFGLHEWLSRSAYYIAIVRKPLERILSLYYYSIQYRAYIRKTQKESGKSLQELFKTDEAADFYADFVPWIEGEQTLSKFLGCNSPELDNGMVRRFSGVGLDVSVCPKEALDIAKENIEKYFSVVGIQERYEDTVGMIRVAFRLNLTEFHVNKGIEKRKKDYKIATHMKRRIKEMNQMDIELYDWVLNRFEIKLLQPEPPVAVQGKGRTDFDKVKLWRAIGSSPIRKAAMEHNSTRNR